MLGPAEMPRVGGNGESVSLKVMQLKADRAPLTVNIDIAGQGVEQLHIVYKPSQYTANAEKEMQKVQDEGGVSDWTLSFVNKLLIEWDLEGDDGKPYPMTVEALATLPREFIVRVSQDISEDMGKRQGGQASKDS